MVFLAVLLVSALAALVDASPPTQMNRQTVGNTGCSPLISNSLNINCSFAGEPSDCSKTQEIGSLAVFSCKRGYMDVPSVGSKQIHCRRDGQWDQTLVNSCTTECGRRNTQKDGGKQFPWNIVIYENIPPPFSDGTWGHVCFGSLITPKTVVSAARCFWNWSTSEKKAASQFKFGAGIIGVRLFSRLHLTDPHVQIRDVQDIRIPVLFRGEVANYQSDIAILTAASPFELTATVSPICLDFDSEFERRQLTDKNKGFFASWGGWFDEGPNNVLRYVEVPYATSAECSARIPPVVRNMLTNDKMCTGPGTGQCLCAGDAGSGLVFQDSDSKHFYLRGIAGIVFRSAEEQKRCNPNNYLGFTLLSQHQQFILENL